MVNHLSARWALLVMILPAILAVAFSSRASAVLIEKEYTVGTKSTNSYPMNQPLHRYHCMITAAELNNTAGNITEFGFRYAYVFSRTWPSIEVYCGETTNTGTTMSTTYDSNFNAAAAVKVYSGSPTLTTTATSPYARFVFQSPFTYSGQNNLIVEVRVNGASTLISGSTASINYWSTGTGARIFSNTGPTVATGSIGASINHGYSVVIEQGSDIQWNGSSSTAWATASNWTPNTVPGAGDNVIIPSGATTPNDPTLTTTSACRKIKIESGGILNGGSGKLLVKGDWENLGTFNKGTSTIEFNDSSNQNVTDAANAFNNVVITNGRATFKNPITAAHTNTYTVNSGAEIAFAFAAVNLSGINLVNNGTVVFGASGFQQTVTTKTNHALKKVIINTPASGDRVTFTGTQNFTTLTLSGAGPVIFPGTLSVSSSFTTSMTGTLTAPLISGAADWTFGQTSSFSTSISIGNADLNYVGSGTTTFNGTHTGYFGHGGNGTCTLNGSMNGSLLEHYGKGALNITGSFNGNDIYHDNSGAITINGSCNARDIENTSSATLTVKGILDASSTLISSNGRIIAQSNATIDDLSLSGTGSYEIYGDLNHPAALSLAPASGIGSVNVYGNCNIGGNLLISPSATASVSSLYVTGDTTVTGSTTIKQSNARFDGAFTTTSVTLEAQAILDINNTNETTFASVSMINSSKLDIAGSLTVSGDVSTANDAQVLIAGNLRVKGDLANNSTKVMKVTGMFTMDGSIATAPQNLSLTSDLECLGILLDSTQGVNLSGIVKPSATTLDPAAVEVTVGTTLVMASNSRFSLGLAGHVLISGKLVSTSGAVNSAPRIGAISASPANRTTVRFAAGSEADISGMIFERVGHPNQYFGVTFDDGAKVTTFNYVQIPDSAAVTAAIRFDTSDVADQILGLFVAGTSPHGIDASGVVDTTITMLLDNFGGGSLYGDSAELDPNLLLFWDASPVVVIADGPSATLAYSNRNYKHQVVVYGGNAPYLYSLANHPSWLHVNALSGELFGVPAESDIGSTSFDILVADSTPGILPVSKNLLLEIEFPPYFPVEFVTESELPGARADEPYAATVEIIEGKAPFTYSLVGAQSWLTINSQSGEISGVPPLLFAGPVVFGVRVADSHPGSSPVTKSYSIVVEPSGYMQIVIETPGQLPTAIEGQSYGAAIEIRDGVAPFTFTLLESPSWLTINPSTGALSGTPPLGTVGTTSLTLQVSDERNGSPAPIKAFFIEVTPVPYTPISIVTPALLPTAGQGVAYQQQIVVADGLPGYLFTLENEPIWLSIDAATGGLFGTPPGAFSGFVNFRVIVRDSKPGQPGVAKDFALEVLRVGDDPVLVNTPPVLFNGTAGSSYYIVLAASGGTDTNYTWFLRAGHSLPAGLTLDSVAGIISGTPEQGAVGDYLFDIGARDSLGNETFQTFSLSVEETPNVEGGLAIGGDGKYDLPERGAAGGCAIASGSNLWMLALMLVLGGLVALRAKRRKLA